LEEPNRTDEAGGAGLRAESQGGGGMTTTMVAAAQLEPIPNALKKRRVLLVDASATKRELRAETMRKLGIDVDCAADISEARSWWRAALYNLVLMNVQNDLGHRD